MAARKWEGVMNESVDLPGPDPADVEQFAAHCAHDFNNLLTGILGNLELMQNRAKRTGVDSFDSYIEGARSAARRAAAFSQRLLIYSGRAAQDATVVAVNPLVADLVDLLRAQAQPVAATFTDDRATVFCDAVQLEIAIGELLANARDAGGGELLVSTQTRSGQVEICVTDAGPGMAAAVLAGATQPFFSTRTNGAGRGLGLAIVERFARQAGGSLHLSSAPGAGTTARLLLPRTPE
jgi:signal transduction histidine kinase